MQTNKFVRKPFYVEGVQVTEDNMAEVAKWCQGQLHQTTLHEDPQGTRYIKVRVNRPLNERQTKAFVGDWVLYAGTGYKVYTTKAFSNSFEATNPQGAKFLEDEASVELECG